MGISDWLHRRRQRRLLTALVIVSAMSNTWAFEDRVFDSQRQRFRVVTLVRGLDYPWGLDFLPGGDMLITERPGRLLRVDGKTLQPRTVRGLPAIAAVGQGGLLDVALHPDFDSNQLVYFSFSGADGDTLGTEVGRVWSHEHGPRGGDEVNILASGRNYGWPVITYGRNYVTGTKIGEGTRKQGMQQPLRYWTPSIAPSGMTFYTGDKFPAWRGNLFIGALKYRLLVRLEVRGQEITHEERMLEGVLGRIRDVRTGPDGYIYLLTDDGDGVLARLEPAR